MTNTLSTTIVDQINEAHAAAATAAGTAVSHAIECGRLLTEARLTIPHGGWIIWLNANVSFSERTAQAYVRLYDRRDELASKAQRVADLPLRQAIKLVSKPAVTPSDPAPQKHRCTPLLERTPESLHQSATLWWDQLASNTLLLSADGWNPQRIADFFTMPVTDIDAIIAPRIPNFNPDGLEKKTTAAIMQGIADHADHLINFLLGHACSNAIYNAVEQGFSPETIADLKGQQRQFERRIAVVDDRIRRTTIDDFTAPLLASVAVKVARHALGIERHAYSSFHVLMELGEAHDEIERATAAA